MRRQPRTSAKCTLILYSMQNIKTVKLLLHGRFMQYIVKLTQENKENWSCMSVQFGLQDIVK